MGLTPEQHAVMRKPLNGTRVAKRSQGGKQLSYLESFDVRAHLIRVFGYANFDVETVDTYQVGTREYDGGTEEKPKAMVECMWFARVRLTVRDRKGRRLARYTDSAIGPTSGPATMIGEHHDNAAKTAASDAMKRCAINLGTQFGLSLYQDGSTRDVVKGTLVVPKGYEEPVPDEKAVQALQHTLGAQQVAEEDDEGKADEPAEQEATA